MDAITTSQFIHRDSPVKRLDFGAIGFGKFDVASTPDIHGPRDGLKVRGVHARTYLAQMVEFHSIRDGADHILVHDAMDFRHLPVDSDGAVSLYLIDGPLPDPARSLVTTVFDDVVIESAFGFGVVRDKRERMAFDVSLGGARAAGDVGLLSASALTETEGDVTVSLHCQGLSDDVAPPVVPATRRFFVA